MRSTWSPCGLSMLSSITPMGEAGRGQGFPVTASWFVAGSVVGGATLGGASAALAAAVSALSAPTTALVGMAAALCAVAAAWDLGILGLPMPVLRRQVNELWLDQFRGWVYGAGFGWQIGAGLTTYVMTAGVLVLVPLGACTGSPVLALSAGVAFGTVRGLTVLLGRGVTSTQALQSAHRRLDRLNPTVQVAVALFLAAVASALGALSWPAVSVLAGAIVMLAGIRAARRCDRAAVPTARTTP